MADKATYPQPADLTAFLNAAGIVDVTAGTLAAIDYQAKLDAATAEWEQRTGWEPFLADAADVTRVFDPPGPANSRGGNILTLRGGGKRLLLDAGLVSLTSLSVAGTAFALGEQFWLAPANAPARRKPWTCVEFLVPVLAPPQGITVVGRWGYRAACPSDAWEAVASQAAYLCAPQLALYVSQGLVGIDDARYQTGSGQSPLGAAADQWRATFTQAVQDYERLV